MNNNSNSKKNSIVWRIWTKCGRMFLFSNKYRKWFVSNGDVPFTQVLATRVYILQGSSKSSTMVFVDSTLSFYLECKKKRKRKKFHAIYTIADWARPQCMKSNERKKSNHRTLYKTQTVSVIVLYFLMQ